MPDQIIYRSYLIVKTGFDHLRKPKISLIKSSVCYGQNPVDDPRRPGQRSCGGGDMTAVIGRTASRAAGLNQMTPARPDQLPPVPPAMAGFRRRDGRPAIRCPHPSSCGPILVVTTPTAAAFYLRYPNRGKCESPADSPTRDSEHSSHNAAIGARPGWPGGHPAAPAGRADRRPRRTGEGGQAGGAGGTPVLCRTGLCDLGAHPRPGAVSGKHSERAGGVRRRLG
jgi:hypothetical protein